MALALACAALGAAWPYFALPAVTAVLVVTLVSRGRAAWVVGVVGGVLALVGTLRFTVELAVPGIIAGGQRSTEEKAVSRLREILWAEKLARERKVNDGDNDGVGEYVTLTQLVTPSARTDDTTLLKPEQYVPVAGHAGMVRAEGYLYRVVMRAADGSWTDDPARAASDAAESGFLAYAWPVVQGEAGRRVFVMDEAERICERATSTYEGTMHIPAPDAAVITQADELGCGAARDGATWTRWKARRIKPPVADQPR